VLVVRFPRGSFAIIRAVSAASNRCVTLHWSEAEASMLPTEEEKNGLLRRCVILAMRWSAACGRQHRTPYRATQKREGRNATLLMTGRPPEESERSIRKLLPPIYPDMLLALENAGRSRQEAKSQGGGGGRPISAGSRTGRGDMRKASTANFAFGGYRFEGTWDQSTVQHHRLLATICSGRAQKETASRRVVVRFVEHAVGFYPRPTAFGTDCHRAAGKTHGRQQKVLWRESGALRRQNGARRGCTCLVSEIRRTKSRSITGGSRSGDRNRKTGLQQLICRIGLDHPAIPFRDLYAALGPAWNERTWFETTAPTIAAIARTQGQDFREHAMVEQAKLRRRPRRRFLPGGHVRGIGVAAATEKESATGRKISVRPWRSAREIRLAGTAVIAQSTAQNPSGRGLSGSSIISFVLAPDCAALLVSKGFARIGRVCSCNHDSERTR